MPIAKSLMTKVHKVTGSRVGGTPLLYLTTVGARSGLHRESPLMRFDDGPGRWLVVASNNGSVKNPSWYHNLRANPDQVWIEIGGEKAPVDAEQLYGDERTAAWARITTAVPRFLAYQQRAGRRLPVLRVTPR